ncbi:LOW QUALITY PROTEIN: uncharacterized protein LOC103935625 [Pyrus x bretschneideri]|uniref:LOW QUALITY PROTEIN: uncharacterized protein LOC103935625 n=1 Tax=Pyrus x bretschneideri TaxID=225117 RepID=UPI00202E471D|nr:LOW QUALITY PROTEIN: uncharacterized protein LOC103935625 [Pyrus x bretschneideri]
MNRSLSSKFAKKASPAPPLATANKKKKQKEQSRRNPLRDLNAVTVGTSNTGSDASSSISVEAPRGCLRFLLSHSSSCNSKTPLYTPKTLSKTPKSAPAVRPTRPSKSKDNRSKFNALENPEKPTSRNASKSTTNSSRSGPSRKLVVSKSNGNSLGKLESGSEVEGSIVRVVGNAGQPTELKSDGIDGNFTPLSKIPTGLGLDSKADKAEDVLENSDKSNSRTPPVQASVSPEIQCGSSVVSTSKLACYSAGHVLSGITDKRKCRGKGILSVGQNDSGFSKGKALGSFEDDDDNADDEGDGHVDGTGKGVVGNLDASVVPLPTEASMHWLLSPCDEGDEDHKEHSDNSLQNSVGPVNLYSPFSTSGRHGFSSDVCENTNMESTTHFSRSTSTSPSFHEVLEPVNEHVGVLSSPHCTPCCEAVTLEEERKLHYGHDSETSPFSMVSLDSGNVICTPQSDSSIENHRKHYFDSELSSVAEAIQMASLSPRRTVSVLIEDQIESSFQFECLTTACSSISQLHKVLDDRASWLSNSTLENISQSEMRISWREGLMSHIDDMDEDDCCRCLSDEEKDINGCGKDPLKKEEASRSPELNVQVGEEDENVTYKLRTAEVLDDEGGGIRPKSSSRMCATAESISTDGGGGLLASGDSDWSQCYKNELFNA